MNITVIMFFSPSVFLCYMPASYLLNDWKLIKEMSKARILVVGNLVLTARLVSVTAYIEFAPRERWKEPEIP